MNTSYTQVPLSDEEKSSTPVLSEQETIVVKKATRVVVFLCFVQLLIALFSFLAGGFIMMCVSSIFISIGVVGAVRQRIRLLVVHFVYSLVLYVLSLIGVVLLILYCDGCKIWIYVAAFFLVLIQAIGMRHSRLLIGLLKKKNGITCVFRCKSSNVNAVPQVAPQEVELAENINMNTNSNVPMFTLPLPLPAHQMVTMQMQPQVPYFPVQSVQYPFMQHPAFIFPNNNNNNINSTSTNQQPQPYFALNPVVYNQI